MVINVLIKSRGYDEMKWEICFLHVVLDVDGGPDIEVETEGVLDTLLVVNPIRDAFGIPKHFTQTNVRKATTKMLTLNNDYFFLFFD